ncbi:MAG: hypothetical protein QJT81_08460 [Candidatus Thiothrix putei]|uniref:Uncharacterized protein n=1 Tax=Candidatus Thiothrix putei TaxID=3080811 RepID=A0AA95HGB6_9GAMM|nr:MAG: hypothetical protein QJT81_08460 [Candidatus Thiothrix putei]
MVARLRRTSGSNFLPQMAVDAPKAIQVRAWGSLSSGIRQPLPDAAQPMLGVPKMLPADSSRLVLRK